jgi:hypothetical protein
LEPIVGHRDPEVPIYLEGLADGELIGSSPRPTDFAGLAAAPECVLARLRVRTPKNTLRERFALRSELREFGAGDLLRRA